MAPEIISLTMHRMMFFIQPEKFSLTLSRVQFMGDSPGSEASKVDLYLGTYRMHILLVPSALAK